MAGRLIDATCITRTELSEAMHLKLRLYFSRLYRGERATQPPQDGATRLNYFLALLVFS
jgi:hypothetical protein